MKKIVSSIMLAALIATATSSQAELSKASVLLGGLGLYFATKGITIADECKVSPQELLKGQRIGSNFLSRFINDAIQDPTPLQARTNIVLSIASFALCVGLSAVHSFTQTDMGR